MRKRTYFRITALLLLPLLALGAWLASHDVSVQAHYQCHEDADAFACDQVPGYANPYRPHVWVIAPSFLLGTEFRHEVRTLAPTRRVRTEGGQTIEQALQPAGAVKLLQMPMPRPENEGQRVPCRLEPQSGATHWHASCVHGIRESFEFTDPAVSARFVALAGQIEAIQQREQLGRTLQRTVLALLPLAGYLLLSLLAWALWSGARWLRRTLVPA